MDTSTRRFPPTPEQHAAVDVFGTGAGLVLEAGAGTGKTSTLELLALSAPSRRGVYVAFNAAIAAEARLKFPRNITVKTTHALAMAGTGFQYQPRLKAPKVPLAMAAARLGVDSAVHVGARVPVRPTTQASLALRTVRRFCSTPDKQIGRQHVPMLEGLSAEDHALLAPHIVDLAQKVWSDVSDPNGHLFRFEHDHYLKVWALQQPNWRYDFVLFDEAQDANPVVSAMVAEQVEYGSQVVAVGDSAQAIYGWRGAVDAMSTFRTEHRLQLTQSFRFGQQIADEANKWLALLGSNMCLKGLASKRSAVVSSLTNPDAILCRGNATVIGELFQGLGRGRRVGLVGGGSDLLAVAWAAQALRAGRPTDHPEFALFENWEDLVDYADSGDDPNLAVLVKIVEDHGPAEIERVVRAATNEYDADLVLSTAHKAKGREWMSVRLAQDFAEPRLDGEGEEITPAPEELMLSYVAVTRAMGRLDRGNLGWIDHPPRKQPTPKRPHPFNDPEHIDTRPGPSGARPSASGPAGSPSSTAPAVANYIAAARRTNVNAYARWTTEADEALLAAYRAGTSLTDLTAAFDRGAGAIIARVTKLHGLEWGKQDVFDAAGTPCLLGVATAQPVARTEPGPDPAPAWTSSEPADHPYPSWEVEAPDDWDDWGADEYREAEEEQREIRATFEYLMERDDI